MTCLEIVSALATILTAGIAVVAYVHFGLLRYRQRRRLEKYLKSEKDSGKDRSQRSIIHLMARVGMTEAEILDASFRSKVIKRKISVDSETGQSSRLLLVYDENANS